MRKQQYFVSRYPFQLYSPFVSLSSFAFAFFRFRFLSLSLSFALVHHLVRCLLSLSFFGASLETLPSFLLASFRGSFNSYDSFNSLSLSSSRRILPLLHRSLTTLPWLGQALNFLDTVAFILQLFSVSSLDFPISRSSTKPASHTHSSTRPPRRIYRSSALYPAPFVAALYWHPRRFDSLVYAFQDLTRPVSIVTNTKPDFRTSVSANQGRHGRPTVLPQPDARKRYVCPPYPDSDS